MTIEKAILSAKEPKETNTAWVQPKGDSLQLNIFNNGKWRPIAGSGNSTTVTNKYPVDPNTPMLSGDSFIGAMREAATKLGFDTVIEPTSEQYEQIFNELKSYKFATPKQGNAVLVNYDLGNNTYTFQCDDGSTITVNNKGIIGLRPDIDGYIIWKTTRDKLPVRENQEETDPDEPNPGGNTARSVKPGPSLKVVTPTDPSTEEVYTVINNNTGEIVDSLELHNLTNVIWYDHFGKYYPFHLHYIKDIKRYELDIMEGSDPISTWVGTLYSTLNFTYLTVSLFYNYTLKPSSASKIQTTNNYSVSDISNFFRN